MDLGTANTIITCNGKIVVDEPSVVALDSRTKNMIAVGNKAKMMYEKAHENIRTCRPLRDGVIADFDACEKMMRGLIEMINNGHHLFKPQLRMVIGIPSGSTEVERRAVRDSAEHSGGREVYLIFEPMASAIGCGLDVEAPEGCMVVDIGGGTTEVAVISLGGIVYANSVRVGGDKMDAEIVSYIRKHHNLLVGESSAEKIKKEIGCACPPEDGIGRTVEIKGRDLGAVVPKEIEINEKQIAEALSGCVADIVGAVRVALENTPPELSADIVDKGIVLTGGGALLKNLDLVLREATGLPVSIAEEPLNCVVKGTGKALDHISKLKNILSSMV